MMDVGEIEATVVAAVRKAMAVEARRAGERRHSHRLRWRERDVRSHWTGRGGRGA